MQRAAPCCEWRGRRGCAGLLLMVPPPLLPPGCAQLAREAALALRNILLCVLIPLHTRAHPVTRTCQAAAARPWCPTPQACTPACTPLRPAAPLPHRPQWHPMWSATQGCFSAASPCLLPARLLPPQLPHRPQRHLRQVRRKGDWQRERGRADGAAGVVPVRRGGEAGAGQEGRQGRSSRVAAFGQQAPPRRWGTSSHPNRHARLNVPPASRLPAVFFSRSKDMSLQEAEVLALSTLKQVMEEKVGGRKGGRRHGTRGKARGLACAAAGAAAGRRSREAAGGC